MSAVPVHTRHSARVGWLPLLRWPFRSLQPAPSAPVPPSSRSYAADLTGLLAGLRQAALTAIGALVAVSSLVSFGESYRGLYEWAARHGLTGFWVVIWPLMVDVFIAVGELTLFVALIDQWRLRSRAAAWAVTVGGLAVSVAGNIGHITGHSLTDRGTAAVPPLAASWSLAVGLGVLKRVLQGRAARAAAGLTAAAATAQAPGFSPDGKASPSPTAAGRAAPAARSNRRRRRAPDARELVTAETVMTHYAGELAEGRVPSQKAIRARWHVGSDRARELFDVLTARAAELGETRTSAEVLAGAPGTVVAAGQDRV